MSSRLSPTSITQCRARLMQWLVETRRPVTLQPALKRGRELGSLVGSSHYTIAADGKESNSHGAATRAKQGRVNYL